MKKNTFVLISLFTTLSSFSQEVVSTQGDTYSNGSGTIDFTIGEVVINTGTDGTNDITQGFHQTNWNFLGIDDQSPNYEAMVYPNPSENILNIRTNSYANVLYSLYDSQGKLIVQDELSSEETAIQVENLAPGNYSISLSNENQVLKTFKLIKTH